MRIVFRAVTVVAFGVAAIGRAEAGFISDRATLESILYGDSLTEGFERYLFAGNTIGNDLVAGSLDSQTIASSFTGNPSPQGPGIVAEGVSFSGNGFIWWTRDGFQGLSTQKIYVGGHIFSMTDTLDIQFTQLTTAFGVDVSLFTGEFDTMTATVFAPGLQIVLGTSGGIVLDGPAPVFVGFSDPGGIGLVQLTRTRHFVSPAIDNLTFGPAPAAVPEPASLALLAAGLGVIAVVLRRRRTSRPYPSDASSSDCQAAGGATYDALTGVCIGARR
jgi:hypothetical protein